MLAGSGRRRRKALPYAVRESELTELVSDTAMRQLERTVLLTTVDRKMA